MSNINVKGHGATADITISNDGDGAVFRLTLTVEECRELSRLLMSEQDKAALETALHSLCCTDESMEERVEAAEGIASVTGHQWPPYPNACAEDCEKDHEHQ